MKAGKYDLTFYCAYVSDQGDRRVESDPTGQAFFHLRCRLGGAGSSAFFHRASPTATAMTMLHGSTTNPVSGWQQTITAMTTPDTAATARLLTVLAR